MKNLKFALLGTILVFVLMSCSETQTGINKTSDENSLDNLGKGGDISAAQPVITGISAISAEIGDLLTVTGKNFGPRQGSGYLVVVNGKNASVYKKWTKSEIQIIVPSGATFGSGYVTVVIGKMTSNGLSFTLLASSPVTIGTQTWMGYNLDVTTYRNGDAIPQVTDPTEWDNLATGAWCYANNDHSTGQHVGILYNWFAVNDPRGLAPEGWHVPSDDEFKTLSMYIGMSQEDADKFGYEYFGTTEGGKLKEQGTNLWISPNWGATNEYGFTALPCGMRSASPDFDFSGLYAFNGLWCSTEYSETGGAWMRGLDRNSSKIYRNPLNKKHGFSVRCIRD